jgi:MFS family permease
VTVSTYILIYPEVLCGLIYLFIFKMAGQEDEVLERQPLLRQRGRSRSQAHNIKDDASPNKVFSWPTFTTISPKYRWVPLLGCILIFTNESEYFIKQVATMRAIESMYCYEYYLARNSPLAELGKHIPERLCKDDSIQKNLAKSAGLIMFFRMLSAMIGAIPLGWLADRYGRKVVLILHKVNVTCACTAWLLLYIGFPKVPIWSLYLSGVPGLIGGNFDIGLAMLFASYTDVMPSATERATLFFLTTSMQYLAQTVCPTIGAFLMNMDGKGGTLVVNLSVSLVLATSTALLTIFAFPETVHESRKDKPESIPDTQDLPANSSTQTRHQSWLSKQSHTLLTNLHASISNIGLLNITLLALSMLFSGTGIKSIDWFALVQYPVIKLHWTFSQASYIVTIQGFLMLLYFSLILPLLNRLAASYFKDASTGHFAIMAGSAGLLILGAMCIGFSSTPVTFVGGVVVYLFGEGLPTATQAFIVSLVEKGKVARVMATLSMASIGGKLLASILFPKVLALGLDTHVGILVGLPFFASAVLFVFAAGCVGVVGLRVRRERKGKCEDD